MGGGYKRTRFAPKAPDIYRYPEQLSRTRRPSKQAMQCKYRFHATVFVLSSDSTDVIHGINYNIQCTALLRNSEKKQCMLETVIHQANIDKMNSAISQLFEQP